MLTLPSAAMLWLRLTWMRSCARCFSRLRLFCPSSTAFRDAGGGHGGLFGGDGEAAQMHDDEADAVVEADGYGFPEGRQPQSPDEDFDECHQADDDAGAGGRQEHAAVFVAGGGDVVFAVVAFCWR